MKGERKLSLVKPPPLGSRGKGSALPPAGGGTPHPTLGEEMRGAVDFEDELEATPEELREAEALRRSLERGEDPMALALQAAFRPGAIEADDLDAILARAMGDEDAAATSIESTIWL